ncbi:MAG TPA: Piwi domain-containing protein [Aggregatilineales bacterium]|nr:Piwi domain-containing protein [Aggregatilineales bacterium]
MTIQIDVFPIDFDLSHHPLAAYRLLAPNQDEAGGVFAARVRKMSKLPAVWLRGQNCLITSAGFTPTLAGDLLAQLHQMALPTLKNLTAVEPITSMTIAPAIIAQYLAEGILDMAYDALSEALKELHVTIGKVQVTRQAQFKGLVIGSSTPAIQITVRSTMNSLQSLDDYLRQHGVEKAKASGLEIKCRSTSGTFDGIVGNLDDVATGSMTHRDRLRGYNPTDYPSSLLDTLPGTHQVVALKPNFGRTVYQYPIRVLKLVVSMANLHQFVQSPSDQREIAGHLKLSPEKRHEIVQRVWNGVQQYLESQNIAARLGAAYNQVSHPTHFSTATSLGFSPSLRFAQRIVSVSQDSEMLPALRHSGVFRIATPTMNVAIVDAIPGEAHAQQRRNQLVRMKELFASMQITLKSTADLLRVSEADSVKRRATLRQQLRDAIRTDPDVILIYLPTSDREGHSADDKSSLYNAAKEVTIGAGVASQVIYQKTLETDYADANIIMGILGKTGNIPYVLAQPLPFTDFVVGLDIGRRKMRNGGALNMGAMSRVFLNDGHMLGYSLASGSILEGETIPPEILEMIFPPEEFGGKRVIVHRDGRFPNTELHSLIEWGAAINAEFYPIEVTKSGTPRMYRQAQGKIDQASKQTIFYVDEETAFIVTSPPPAFKNVAKTTAQPLKIRNRSPLSLNQALLSVISLTLLHYGSVRPPRLPVSTHASDKIAGFLLRDIRPSQMKGDRPFWL